MHNTHTNLCFDIIATLITIILCTQVFTVSEEEVLRNEEVEGETTQEVIVSETGIYV